MTDVFMIRAIASGVYKSGTWLASRRAAAASADDVASRAGAASSALKILDKCFAAGTPILTPNGHVSIESLTPGDLVLARAENDATAPVVARRVERVFELAGAVMQVHAGGQIIKTTPEHPFYVDGKGWCVAGDLWEGDLLVGHNERKTRVERTILAAEATTVYNLRVATDHTYFVGTADWGFSLWVHNTYVVRPGAASGTFDLIDEASNTVIQTFDKLDEANAVANARNAAIAANTPNPIFRGGTNLEPRLGIDVKKASDGLIHPLGPNGKPQGLSLNIDPKNSFIQKYGGAFPVDSLPEGLQILQSGNPGHYVIAPKWAMTFEAYEALCKQVSLLLRNKIP